MGFLDRFLLWVAEKRNEWSRYSQEKQADNNQENPVEIVDDFEVARPDPGIVNRIQNRRHRYDKNYDEVEAALAAIRATNVENEILDALPQLITICDERVTMELYLMWSKDDDFYTYSEHFEQMTKKQFCNHVSLELNPVQVELLVALIKNSLFDDDTLCEAIIPIVDERFEPHLKKRLKRTRENHERFLKDPLLDWDHMEQNIDLCFREQIQQFEKLLQAIKR
ncbi:hypothetical protein ACFL35_10040 [Candidatus Riflebacteria bacterium]